MRAVAAIAILTLGAILLFLFALPAESIPAFF